MQAIHEYSKTGDYPSIRKWLSRLVKHYNSMGEMVPEWKDRLKPGLITDLKSFTQIKDQNNINRTLNSIPRTCNNCHDDFQAVVTTLYRTPDYDEIKIMDNEGRKQSLALQARDTLASQLLALGNSCNSCHKDDPYPKDRILGTSTQQQLLLLKRNIQQNRTKDSQKLMGQFEKDDIGK